MVFNYLGDATHLSPEKLATNDKQHMVHHSCKLTAMVLSLTRHTREIGHNQPTAHGIVAWRRRRGGGGGGHSLVTR
jgi:hypothetical protein